MNPLPSLLILSAVWLAVGCGASCLLCNKQPDAITLLNNKLVDLTPELSLEANVKAARAFRQDPNFKAMANESLAEAVDLFRMIEPNEPCSVENLRLVRGLIELADKKNLEEINSSGSQRRLIRFLYEFTFHAKWNCFRVFQAKWSKHGDESELRLWETVHELEFMKPALMSRARRCTFEKYEDAKELNGAIELLRNYKSSGEKKLFTSSELKSILGTIHERKTGFKSLKVDEKRGKKVRVDPQTGRQLLDEYLLKPCQKLLEAPEASEIFKPVRDLGAIVQVDDLARFGSDHHPWPMLEWTARYVACELLLEQPVEQLVEKVTKSLF